MYTKNRAHFLMPMEKSYQKLSISTSPSYRISPNSDVIDDETFTKEKYKI